MSTNTPTTPDIGALRDVVSQFKKGYKTTEFWVAALSAAIPAGAWLAHLFGYDVETEELLAASIGLAPGLGYILQRGWVKKQRNVTVAQVASGITGSLANPDLLEQILKAISVKEEQDVEEIINEIETGQDKDLDGIRDEAVSTDPGTDQVDTQAPPS